MNSSGNYYAQIAEIESEEGPSAIAEYQGNERIKALASYPDGKNVEVRYCSICGEPLRYRSVSYDEGWHIDSCL
jgi:hypothetical protein